MRIRYPFGTFNKATPGALAINFAPSSGHNCDLSCPLHRDNGGGCYATAAEKHRPNITRSLAARALAPVEYVRDVLDGLNKANLCRVPWVRFSVFGSLPLATDVEVNPILEGLLRRLALRLRPHAHKVHLPVETMRKATLYRALGFFPRLSLATAYAAEDGADGGTDGADKLKPIRDTLNAGLPVSITSDDGLGEGRGWTKRQREHARRVTIPQLRRAFPDKKVRGCPAVLGNAKCGACRLCADPQFGGADIVVYPLHP
jgi:hypothetical protein